MDTQHQNMEPINTNKMKVWIAFSGQTEIPFLKVLKKDFRHCFAIVHDGERWFSIDPLSNYMEVTVHNVPADFDLPNWIRKRGYKVIAAQVNRTHRKIAPVLPFTCVEAVKRFLGIHAWNIITPWQLYKHLKSEELGQRDQHYKTTKKEIYHGQFAFST